MPLLIILSIAQILFFLIGINTSPLVMIILPIGVIIFWWLINNPAISLMFLSLTAIIKGYLINYYPIFELIDITVVVTIIIWLGLIKMFIQDGWNISTNLKEVVYIFLFFGILPSHRSKQWEKEGRGCIFNSWCILGHPNACMPIAYVALKMTL